VHASWIERSAGFADGSRVTKPRLFCLGIVQFGAIVTHAAQLDRRKSRF
jgi:hypothetical protein